MNPVFRAGSKNAVILLSGGLESAAILWWAARHYGADNLLCVAADFGHKARIELVAARRLADIVGVGLINTSIRDDGDNDRGILKNNRPQTAPGIIPLPRNVYRRKRNILLISLAANVAECYQFLDVFIGYEDIGARERQDAFFRGINQAVQNHDKIPAKPPHISSPVLSMTKADIVQAMAADEGGMDFLAKSFSCFYPVGVLHCGHCESCSDRKKAFAKAGVSDPTEYNT